MSLNLPDSRRERAAVLIAEGTHTNGAVAAAVGVTQRTVERWRREPSFIGRVTDICATMTTQLVNLGIAERQARVDALNDAFLRLDRVIAERAADPTMADVPGGTTGLLVRTWKTIGAGEAAQALEEYAVDTATLRERRATLQQAAQELGQWADKSESSVEQHVTYTIAFDRAEPHD